MTLLKPLRLSTAYETTHNVVVNNYELSVILFENESHQIEITIKDLETGITYISDENYKCPGTALLAGLQWIEKNV